MTRRLVAELVATALLTAAIIGAGIGAAALTESPALSLMMVGASAGLALVTLILAFGPASGAHLNPAVSLSTALLGGMAWTEALAFTGSQLAGGVVGAMAANLMFSEPAITISDTTRDGGGVLLAEAIATFGLVAVILGCTRARRPSTSVAVAVGAYIVAAHFFTASGSFANPAVTVGRIFSDSFTGIAPGSALGFIPAQLVGAAAAVALMRWLYPTLPESAERISVPHAAEENAEALRDV